MRIINQSLWDAASEHFRDICTGIMVGASTASVALYFGLDHPQYPGEYRITWAGPRSDAQVVATNLDTWI